MARKRKPRGKRKTPRHNVTSQNIQPSESEFSLGLHSTNVETLLESECLPLMGIIQFRWLVAEREVHNIMVYLNQKDKAKRSEIGADVQDFYRRSLKRPELRPYKDAIGRLHKAFMEVRDDRNTLVHGKLITGSAVSTIFHFDTAQDSETGHIPFFRRGEMMLVRKDRRVLLKADPLREIDQRVSVLLQVAYELWQVINPSFEIAGTMSIKSDNPLISFGDGRKTVSFQRSIRIRDL